MDSCSIVLVLHVKTKLKAQAQLNQSENPGATKDESVKGWVKKVVSFLN